MDATVWSGLFDLGDDWSYDFQFKKRLYPQRKVIMRKNFEIEIFIIKCVLDHSKSIPTKKYFRPKFFVSAIFSTYEPQSFEKWLCPLRNVIMGKNFEIQIFILKFILDHSESIPIKNFCRPKFFVFAIFRPMAPFFA